MHVVVSPILLVLFYFGAVLPIGLVLRLFGKDLLRLKRNDKTYWIERQPPGAAAQDDDGGLLMILLGPRKVRRQA